jgi:MinD-like ATPase involved in chromosome partitioning or flagellar assembly
VSPADLLPPASGLAPVEPLTTAEPPPLPEAQQPAEPVPPVQVHPQAEALPPLPAPVVKAVSDPEHVVVPSIERALSGPAKHRDLSWHGTVKIVAGATQGPGKRDQEALDRARARLPLKTPKRVVVLGCTSGGGQTMTTLMTGHILASLREEPVAAVDLHDGALARYSAPAAWLEDVLSGRPPQNASKARPDGLHPGAKATPAGLDVIASRDPLGDGDELKLVTQLNRHYSLALLDPGATGLTKLLTMADQLVIVVPASVDGAGALADTREWLETHGFGELAGHSVTVINGVSRRSLPDVEHAESVARGRCRAIVRVPWDDMLPVEVAGPSSLRPQTRVAYTALAGVLVAGLAAAPIRTGR